MSTLQLALADLLADTIADHWAVEYALRGVDAPGPNDAELAALVATVRKTGTTDLAELADQHPEAVRRHREWATDPSMPNSHAAA